MSPFFTFYFGALSPIQSTILDGYDFIQFLLNYSCYFQTCSCSFLELKLQKDPTFEGGGTLRFCAFICLWGTSGPWSSRPDSLTPEEGLSLRGGRDDS